MSKEHLWPEWMHPYLPEIPEPKYWTAVASATDEYEQLDRLKPQMGHVYTKHIKVVCRNCNSGWMGDIEETVIPILTPIIQGYFATLGPDEQCKLATWVALKVLVAEHDKYAMPVSTKPILKKFMKNHTVPDEMKIWIGRHNVFAWSSGWWSRGLTMSSQPKMSVRPLRKNIQTSAIGIGQLFTLAFFSRFSRVHLEIDNPFVFRIWPIASDHIEWPIHIMPPPMVGALANILDDLEARPDVVWGTVSGSQHSTNPL